MNLNKICLFLVVALFCSNAVFAKPINQVRERIEIDFGTVIVDPSGDTITLTPSGSIFANGLSFFSGTPTAGQFTARGDKNASFTISFLGGSVLTGPGPSMSLGAFTHNAGSTPFFDGGGRVTINIGASLTVNTIQSSGNYTGTYTIILEYP